MNGAFTFGRPEDLTPDEYDVLLQFHRDVGKASAGETDDGIEIDMDEWPTVPPEG